MNVLGPEQGLQRCTSVILYEIDALTVYAAKVNAHGRVSTPWNKTGEK
jgi:hypothetical protein